MNIKQLYYTSMGGSGRSVKNTSGVSDKESKQFTKLAESADSKKTLYQFDCTECGYFLSRSIPGTDKDGRDTVFFHGLLFEKDDAKVLLENYNDFLKFDCFLDNADADFQDVSGLPSKSGIVKQPAFGKETLVLLTEAVLEAIINKRTIQVKYPHEDKEAAIKAVMSCIYGLIPLSMRQQISFCSDSGNNSRTVALTDDFNNADIGLDYDTQTFTGLTNEFSKAAECFANHPETMTSVERYLEDSDSLSDGFESTCKKALDCALIKIHPEDFAEDIIVTIYDVMENGEYNTPSSAEFLADCLKICTDNSEKISDSTNEKIIGIFDTDLPDCLKQSITDYENKLFFGICTPEACYGSLEKVCAVNSALGGSIADKVIQNGVSEFIAKLADEALKNPACPFDLNALSEDSVNKIINAVSDTVIADDSNEKILLVFDSPCRDKIIDSLIGKNQDYFKYKPFIEKSLSDEKYRFTSFNLNDESKCFLVDYLCNYITDVYENDTSRAADLIKQLCKTDSNTLKVLNKVFSQRGRSDIIDFYYTRVLLDTISLPEAKDAYIDAKRKGINLPLFADTILGKMSADAPCDSLERAKKAIADIKDFCGQCGVANFGYVNDIKRKFWNLLRYDQLELTKRMEYSELLYDSMPKQETIEVMFELGKSMDTRHYDQRTVTDAVTLLTSGEGHLSTDERNMLIENLRNHCDRWSGGTSSLDLSDPAQFELYLLLNYSYSGERGVCRITDRSPKTLKGINKYLDFVINGGYNRENNHQMIWRPSVLNSMYSFMENYSNDGQLIRSTRQMFVKFVRNLPNKDKYKSIKEAVLGSQKTGFDFSIISSFCVIAIFAVLFVLLNTKWLTENKLWFNIGFALIPAAFTAADVITDKSIGKDELLMLGLQWLSSCATLATVAYAVISMITIV